MRLATQVLAAQGRQQASIRTMLLLTDGGASATDPDPLGVFVGGFCPPSTWPAWMTLLTVPGYTGIHTPTAPYAEPLCLRLREYTPAVGSPIVWPNISRTCLLTGTMEFMCGPGTTIKQSTNPDYAYYYDADDYARDQADYMASNGIVAYVVGLGPFVSGLNEDGTPFRIPGHECDHPLNADSSLSDACPDTRPARDPAGAERLLRYIADMGFDPAKKLEGKAWPCNSDYWNGKPKLPTGQHCGNYWYGAAGVELPRVFEAVDSHIMGGFRVYLPVVTKEG